MNPDKYQLNNNYNIFIRVLKVFFFFLLKILSYIYILSVSLFRILRPSYEKGHNNKIGCTRVNKEKNL